MYLKYRLLYKRLYLEKNSNLKSLLFLNEYSVASKYPCNVSKTCCQGLVEFLFLTNFELNFKDL